MSQETFPPLVARGLNHWFGEGETRRQVLYNLNLTLERGTMTILVGPSGSGKTTLLTLFGCLREISSGSVRLLGRPLENASSDDLVLLRRRIGFIFQANNLHESLTAQQNVLMSLDVQGPGDRVKRKKIAVHRLEELGLGERLDYLPPRLSGGQKQRVAIARALASEPQIIFADEPTAALDEENSLHVIQLLRNLGKKNGATTLMVTHDKSVIALADRVVTLHNGRIVSDT